MAFAGINIFLYIYGQQRYKTLGGRLVTNFYILAIADLLLRFT